MMQTSADLIAGLKNGARVTKGVIGKWWWKALKFGFLGIVVVFGLILVCSFVINRWMNDGSGRVTVCQMIEEATFASCQIEEIDSFLPRGVKIKGLSLRLKNGPTTFEIEPSLKIQEIRARISLQSALYGTLKIKDALLEGVEFRARREKGELWIKPTLDLLAERAKSNNTVKQQPSEPKPPLTVSAAAGLRDFVYLPFRIKIEEMGLKNLKVWIVDVSGESNQERLIHLGGLNATAGFTGWGKSSTLWFKANGADPENKLTFEFTEAKKSKIKKSFDFQLNGHLKDLNSLEIAGLTKGLKEDLSLTVNLGFKDSLKVFELSKIDLKIGKFLNHNTNGQLTFMKDRWTLVDSSINSKTEMDLSRINPLLELFAVKVSGDVRVDPLSINGPIDLESFKELKSAVVPKIKLNAALKKISLSFKDELEIKDLNFEQKTATFEGPLAEEKNIRTSSNLTIDQVKYLDEKTKKDLEIRLANLAFSTSAFLNNILDLEKISLKALEGSFSIEQINAKAKGLKEIRVPFKASLHGSAERAFKDVVVKIETQMDPLFSADLDLQSQNEGQRITLKLDQKTNSLAHVVAFAKPILGELADKIPVIKGGKIQTSVDLKVNLPPGKYIELAKRARKATGAVSASFNLRDLSVFDPKTNANIERIQVSANLSGTPLSQTLAGSLRVEQVSHPSLKAPLLDNQVTFDIGVADLSRISIRKIESNIPSFGATSLIVADIDLLDDYKPSSIKTHLIGNLQPDKVTKGLLPLDASGDASVDMKINTSDMDEFSVSGQINLKNFSASIPEPSKTKTDDLKLPEEKSEKKAAQKEAEKAADKAARPLLAVKNINGSLPIYQTVKLSKLRPPTSLDSANTTVSTTEEKEKKPKELSELIDVYLERNKPSDVFGKNRMKIESFEEVRPSLISGQNITVERASFRELEVDSIEVNVEITQGLFSLNQLLFNFLGGKVYVSTQASFDTKLRQVRIVGQGTSLNTNRLVDSFPKLKEKLGDGKSFLGDDPMLDGIVRLNYDAVSGDISGGIEVTRIGKEQLKTMLLYVDPDEKNPTIGLMRKALIAGDLRQVSVPIKNGLIGVDLDVRFLSSVPIPIPRLQRFPLSQLVKNFTGKQPKEEAAP